MISESHVEVGDYTATSGPGSDAMVMWPFVRSFDGNRSSKVYVDGWFCIAIGCACCDRLCTSERAIDWGNLAHWSGIMSGVVTDEI